MALPVALVTGASSGIGRATALRIVEAGYTVYGAARNAEALAELAPAGVLPLPLDLTDNDSLARAVARVEARHGGIDALVNNAGYSEMGPVEEVPLDRVRRQFQINVFGAIRLIQLVLPGMRRRGYGRIVNVSSMGGELTVPFAGIYHASKYALEAISDALRFEVEPYGIQVVVVQPGVVRTPLGAKTLETLRWEEARPYAARLRQFRAFLEKNADDETASRPEDVAAVILTALEVEVPETRYKVGEEAQRLPELRRQLGDRGWDQLYRDLLAGDE